MTDLDPISTSNSARSARESLSRALTALQGDPSVPPKLAELAAPIAQAMGALHQIERTHQVAPHAEVAVNHVRGALAQLQAQHANHPAATLALEAVASSLSLVHSLSRLATAEAAKAPRPQPPSPQGAPAMPMQPNAAPAPKPAVPVAARDPFAAPPGRAAGGPTAQALAPTQAAPAAIAGPAAKPAQGPSAAGGNVQLINADLGAHSPTNFYKGLSGNDIIDHGGLFISTYVLPKLNAEVRVKVSLPGGYEFEANAVVKWSRDDGGADSPPGFGAQFTAITAEARQLVYRYVRNREPIFHDDF